jgi:hypothetical protein
MEKKQAVYCFFCIMGLNFDTHVHHSTLQYSTVQYILEKECCLFYFTEWVLIIIHQFIITGPSTLQCFRFVSFSFVRWCVVFFSILIALLFLLF